MISINDSMFSPSWKPYIKRLVSMVLAFGLAAFAGYKFITVINFNLIYLSIIMGGIVFLSLAPIYVGRKEDREELFIRHLRTLPLDKLEMYSAKVQSQQEKDLIDAIIGEKLYNF